MGTESPTPMLWDSKSREAAQPALMATAMLAARVASPGGDALTAKSHPYFSRQHNTFSLVTLRAALAGMQDASLLEAAYRALTQQLRTPAEPRRGESLAAWCEREAKGGATVYVLLWASTERGFTRSRAVGCLTLVHAEDGSGPIEIWDVAICSESHGRGLGRAMLGAVQSAAASVGCDLWLSAVPGANHFYLHLGFVDVEGELELEGEAGSAEQVRAE